MFGAGLASIALTACAPEVALVAPYQVASGQWNDDTVTYGNGLVGSSPVSPLAWSAFGSEQLAGLIARAHSANPDIAIAGARIMQARGDLMVAGAAGGPSLTFDLDGSSDIRNLRGQNNSSNRFGSANLDISYDLDLFGENRARRDAGRAQLRATGYDNLATRLAIESEVARSYVGLSAFSEQIVLAQNALSDARELERIVRLRAQEGLVNPVEIGLQVAETNEIGIALSRLVEARARAQTALSILLGEEAPAFRFEAARLSDLIVPQFERIQPAQLLARRPDILAAEARIAAANGNIGQARAAFFPQIRLSATSFVDFATNGIGVPGVALGANILSSIFDSGGKKGSLLRAQGEQIEAAENYRKTILVALGEAQNAMASSSEAQNRLTLLSRSHALAVRTADAARAQYLEGVITQTALNESESQLRRVEEELINARKEHLESAISLFQALGGAPVL